MKTTIYFVRHAKPTKEKNDYLRPLTSEGLEDRMLALELLKDKPIDLFYSSPYIRSYETIAPLAACFKKEIITDYRFRERENGVDGNKTHNHIKMRWDDRTYHEPGGECLLDCQKRNVEALKELLEEHEGKTIVIGTHGTACCTILNYYLPEVDYAYFMDVIDKMPFILQVEFEGQTFLSSQMLGYVYKEYKG